MTRASIKMIRKNDYVYHFDKSYTIMMMACLILKHYHGRNSALLSLKPLCRYRTIFSWLLLMLSRVNLSGQRSTFVWNSFKSFCIKRKKSKIDEKEYVIFRISLWFLRNFKNYALFLNLEQISLQPFITVIISFQIKK